MARLTLEKQMESLKNGMEYYNIPKKYFLHNDGSKAGRFAIATEEEHGAIHTHSRFMSYDEFNAYLMGYYDAKMNKFHTN